MKIIHFLVMSGLDETHGSMGWKIITKLAESNPDGKTFLASLPDQGQSTQDEVGECVYDILNRRLF